MWLTEINLYFTFFGHCFCGNPRKIRQNIEKREKLSRRVSMSVPKEPRGAWPLLLVFYPPCLWGKDRNAGSHGSLSRRFRFYTVVFAFKNCIFKC